jgi:4-hydroxy-3-polyprenylbenzoate decarboxylase
MTDMFGKYASPAVVFDEIRVNGQWMKGPVLGNVQAHWFCECLLWGLEPEWDDYYASYWKAKDYLTGMLEKNKGRFPEIPRLRFRATRHR